MQSHRTLAAVALAFTLNACSSDRNDNANDEPALSVEPQPLVIVASNDQFAIDLYKQMAKSEEGSFVLSPYSVMNALGMAYLGAAGETKAQMAKVMHLSDDIDGVETKIFGPSEDIEIHSANRVWIDNSAPIKGDYIAMCKGAFRADPQQVDFSGNPAGAARLVNDWVEAQTQGKIRDLIDPNAEDRVLVLTNAVYFKGKWISPFKEYATKLEPFYLASGDETKMPLMHQQFWIEYYEDETVQVADFSYEGREFSFTVVLPRDRDGLAELEAGLTTSRFFDWIERLARSEVNVHLARFKTQVKSDLKRQLSPMGMPIAFTSDADFTRMSDRMRLFIGAVIHDAFVEVDESGTEAAAATAVDIVKSAAPHEPEATPPVFRTDHPFLYMVRHRQSGAILFIGRFQASGGDEIAMPQRRRSDLKSVKREETPTRPEE
jgi:serpin B